MLEKALVVDNNQVILKILSHILQTRGLLVQTAKDGLSALNILQGYHPDIIFTDLIMPNIDGENLCRIISGNEEFSKTLLVVVSAVEDNVDFLGFGAHTYIAKGPASEMSKSIDYILSHVKDGRIDLVKGKKLGVENLVPHTISKELLESQKHLKVIFDNIDNGVLEFTKSGAIVNCNSYIPRLLGENIVKILSSDIRDLFSSEAYRHVDECLELFQADHTPVECKHPILIEDKYVVFKFIKIPESTNSTSIMILRDITEEQHARRKLKNYLGQLEELVFQRTKSYEDANKKLQIKIEERKRITEELEFVARQWNNTFDTISDFVSVHDRNMKVVRVNKVLANFLGKEPEDLMGRFCYEVMHGRNKPWENCPHLTAIKRGEPVTLEVIDDAIGIPLLITCSPLMHDDGSLLGSVHVARDISEQKIASDLREKLIKQLEESLARVKLLSGFIPICASCKNIRDDKGYWKQVEEYIRDHSEAEFSHSICPDCMKKLYPEFTTKSE